MICGIQNDVPSDGGIIEQANRAKAEVHLAPTLATANTRRSESDVRRSG